MNKKQTSYKGSFRKTPSGKWEYRIHYHDKENKNRIKSFTEDSKQECLDRAKVFEENLAKSMAGIDIDATIPDIVRRKLTDDYEKHFTGEQGYDRNLHTLNIIEKSYLGKIPIADLRPEDLNFFLKDISSKYSNNTISKVYGQLKIAYKMAVYQGLLDKNIMESGSLRCPKSQKRDKVVRALTEEEQRRFLETLEQHKVPSGRNNYKAQLLIELYSGLRMGEINALRPADIHLTESGGFIHVQRTVARGLNCRPFIKEGTKTDAGVRDVPISKPLIPVLEQALKDVKKNPYGLLFYDYIKGSIIETTQVNCFYRRICEKSQIPMMGQHSLRHTFVSACAAAGISPFVIKTWLGHTDIHITLDTYADVFDRLNQSAVSKFDDYFDTVISKENCEDQKKL